MQVLVSKSDLPKKRCPASTERRPSSFDAQSASVTPKHTATLPQDTQRCVGAAPDALPQSTKALTCTARWRSVPAALWYAQPGISFCHPSALGTLVFKHHSSPGFTLSRFVPDIACASFMSQTRLSSSRDLVGECRARQGGDHVLDHAHLSDRRCARERLNVSSLQDGNQRAGLRAVLTCTRAQEHVVELCLWNRRLAPVSAADGPPSQYL